MLIGLPALRFQDIDVTGLLLGLPLYFFLYVLLTAFWPRKCLVCQGKGWISTSMRATPFICREDKARLQANGNCRHCGYDLTGNISGICPECGTTVL